MQALRKTRPNGTLRLLLVDDDPIFGQVMRQAAAQRNVELVVLELVGRRDYSVLQDFDLVLVDYELRNINGVQFARFLEHYRPDLQSILISSYSKIPDFVLPRGIKAFVPKSVGPGGILDAAINYCRPNLFNENRP